MSNKITIKQINDLNSRCKNNWEFDIGYFATHQEKTFIKRIKVDDEGYLKFKLYYNSQNQIALNIIKYKYMPTMQHTTMEELIKTNLVDKTKYTRKNVNNLIIVTSRLTDEELLKINSGI